MAEADGSGLRLDGARWLADELRVAAVGADNASVEMLPFGDRTRPRLRIFLRRAGAQIGGATGSSFAPSPLSKRGTVV
jgi:hypothetical protein